MIATLCSTDIVWEDKEANFKRLDELFDNIPWQSDLIVLPEMFSTGFTMNISLAEDLTGESVRWLLGSALRRNCALITSIPFLEKRETETVVYNRALFVTPSGIIGHYDKRHLFRMGRETQFYTPGDRLKIIEYCGVKFALSICYDLRFPVWTRNTPLSYDALVNVANFPLSRVKVIDPLVKARAIENMAYALFANRSGSDPECSYSPSSLFSDYKGDLSGIQQDILCTYGKIQVIKGEIQVDKLREFREKFPAWMDADLFKLL